jgi:hypothetical protein
MRRDVELLADALARCGIVDNENLNSIAARVRAVERDRGVPASEATDRFEFAKFVKDLAKLGVEPGRVGFGAKLARDLGVEAIAGMATATQARLLKGRIEQALGLYGLAQSSFAADPRVVEEAIRSLAFDALDRIDWRAVVEELTR